MVGAIAPTTGIYNDVTTYRLLRRLSVFFAKTLRTKLDPLNGTRVGCAALSSEADKNGFPCRASPGESGRMRVGRHICRR
jgi:hypothetical protein